MEAKKVQLLEMLKMYEGVYKLFAESYETLSRARDLSKAAKFDLEELVNRMFILKKTSEMLDDLRKEADGVLHIMEQICCIGWVQKHTNNPAKSEPIRASFATGSPKVGMRAVIPRLDRDREKFISLMKHFGLSEEQAELNLLRPHWPSMCIYLTELAEEGKPLPPGISPNETAPIYSVNTVTRRDLANVNQEIKAANNDDSKIEEILDRHE